MTLDQANRALQIKTPLGENALLLTTFSGREEMSRLFQFHLDLLSENPAITPKDMIGKPVTVSYKSGANEGNQRFFHGYVARFSAGHFDTQQKVRQYRAEIVPGLWFLTRNANCLVFQNKTVPAIIEDIFKRRGFTDYEMKVDQAAHPAWEYCVQYRETDFNFISRLMEQEGISYFFKHGDGKDTMVITDQTTNYVTCDPAKLNFMSSTGGSDYFDHFTHWEHQFQFRTGKWTQTDYDFTKPTADLKTSTSMTQAYDSESKYEIYDYPEEYPVDDKMVPAKSGYGTTMTRRRQEEEETQQDVVVGSGHALLLSPGVKFTVGKHIYKEEEGKAYVITTIQHTIHEPSAYGTGEGYGGEAYANNFSCIPATKPYRPARLTPKPSVQGTQTAIVVGPKGQEIYTDEFGRIKVQFHWDREGKRDENSSLFIRVAQVWAGKRWGATFIPRIGQEVVVSFLEGDPDRPLIIGSVYNGDQRPPYLGNGLDSKHPNEKNISGIKSNSTLGGEGFNELRFDDTKGKEELFIHAQRDMDTRVLNESRERIIGNRHQIIGWEKDGKKGGDWRTKVYGHQHVHVLKNHVESVEGNYQLKVAGEEGGNLDLVVEKNQTEKIGKNVSLQVGGDQSESVGGSLSLQVQKNQQSKVGEKFALESGQEVHIKAGMKLIIEAGMQVSIVGPGGFIDIGPAGVTIQGTMVKINSGGAAGNGSGSSPTGPESAKEAEPVDPAVADDSKSGIKSAYT